MSRVGKIVHRPAPSSFNYRPASGVQALELQRRATCRGRFSRESSLRA